MHSNPTPYMPPSARYRQPWAPAVPSTLGMSRPVMHSISHAGGLRTEEGGSDHGADAKTTPATPVKEEHSTSPTRRSGTDE
jgi:hypothetical protein